ncbi:MAG: hypothetical protein K8R58_00645, partial [Bacteroidales bacterium]|nr:hypothetical protein [Bacteroidales bacterium]
METKTIDIIKDEIKKIKEKKIVSNLVYRQGHTLYLNGQSQLLTQSKYFFEFSVEDEFNDFAVKISVNENITAECNCKAREWCHHKIACLMQLHEELTRNGREHQQIGKEYTQQGMIKRVLEERREKARKAEYRIEFADNIYGEHILYNEKGQQYKLTFYNFKKEHGYCSCPDYKTNKLGTCKHLIFAFNYFKTANKDYNKKKQRYPFVEIFLNPLKDYCISWYYPHPLEIDIHSLIKKYFGIEKFLPDEKIIDFLGFIQESEQYKQIFIRPEVLKKIETAFNKEMLSE